MTIDRRRFLRTTGVTIAGAGIAAAMPMEMLAALRKRVSPSDVIRVGVIGIRGQGWSNISSMLKLSEVQCAAICDVDQNVLNSRRNDLDKLGIKPKEYSDYRKMLGDKDIDVVIIASPDHWHCLQMVDAVAAGKDVFVEKPVSNSVYEAQLMADAARRYNKIVQVAQWQRSQQHFREAIAFVHSGKLGKIASTKAWMYRGALHLYRFSQTALCLQVWTIQHGLGPLPKDHLIKIDSTMNSVGSGIMPVD